ncbi:MAG: GNAT family N-acetyltransferase [Alphaproteobacteria bacterium]|nr:GNAT family N-acetyltransferase [Alphaproteobacteria bacterium]
MIRAAERADLRAIVPLLEELDRDGTRADPRYRVRPEATARMAETLGELWFDRFLPFPPCLVAEVDGVVVGLVSALPAQAHPILDDEPTARIQQLYVRPDHRRRGLARALVQGMVRHASQAGYPRIEVSTLALDGRALAFWRASGFSDLRVVLARLG